ncbi:MAG: undecaprenyl-diphosphate phosphatase, partial [Candidatus Woesearchaeota archaeon]
MDIFQAIILGIVQGITEWLPISSKSHLIIMQRLFGITQPAIFDLILHLGSLLVIFVVFWKDIKELVIGVLNGKRESLMMALFIVIATIPIVIVGFLFEDVVTSSRDSLYVLGFGFLFTALMIFLSQYPRVKSKGLNFWNSLIIGIGEMIALFPGVSRSGTTISTGMILGIKKDVVAKFSFIMFIPAIVGATILEFKDVGQIENFGALAIGTIVTVIVGYLSLKLLLNIIKNDKFKWFSIYCLLLGVIVLLFAYG